MIAESPTWMKMRSDWSRSARTPPSTLARSTSCSISGEMLRIGLGGVARIAIVHSTGLDKPELSAEDIAENIDAVMDLTGAQVALAVPV